MRSSKLLALASPFFSLEGELAYGGGGRGRVATGLPFGGAAGSRTSNLSKSKVKSKG